MSRLIDADKLKNYIHNQNGRPAIGMTFGEMIEMFIDEQPTAFNLDKVIEELEDKIAENQGSSIGNFFGGYREGLKDAIEIVRNRGGSGA